MQHSSADAWCTRGLPYDHHFCCSKMSVYAPFLIGLTCFSWSPTPVWAVFFFLYIQSTAPHLAHISLSLSPGDIHPPARKKTLRESPTHCSQFQLCRWGTSTTVPSPAHAGGHLLTLQTVLWRATVLKTCGKP